MNFQVKVLAAALSFIIIGINTIAQETDSFTDPRDFKKYKTIKIGKQTWMAQDLDFYAQDGSWCYKDDSSNCEKFGHRLYNWKTAAESCPSGWHLPSVDEWTELIDFLGGNNVAGSKLKSKNGWNISNIYSTNSSGFSAFPGGYRNYGAVFGGSGTEGYWWSATNLDSGAWYFSLRFDTNTISKYGSNHKLAGFSVRCLKN